MTDFLLTCDSSSARQHQSSPRIRRTLLTALILLAPMLHTAPANAAVVLSNIGLNWLGGYGFSPDNSVGLGFQSGPDDGSIDAISFSLIAGGSATSQSITFSVLLYALGVDTLPTGSALSTDTGVTATWTNPVGGAFQQQTFSYTSTDLPDLFSQTLSADTSYGIFLSQGSGLPAFEHYWAAHEAPANYSTGLGYTYLGYVSSTDGGSSWKAELPDTNARPLIMELSVSPASAAPAPSTLLLMLLGGAVLAGRSRKRRNHTEARPSLAS